MVSDARYVAVSTLTVLPSGASSRITVAECEPGPRKLRLTGTVLGAGPHITARNHRRPDLRANTAASPISDSGRTMVSSQIEGIFRTTSTAGLARRFVGLAAIVSNGLANTTIVAI